MPFTANSLPLIVSFDKLRISFTGSYLINAKAIPEIMISIRKTPKNLFLTDRYIQDNKDTRMVKVGKY
jgi:hypothetical protein